MRSQCGSTETRCRRGIPVRLDHSPTSPSVAVPADDRKGDLAQIAAPDESDASAPMAEPALPESPVATAPLLSVGSGLLEWTTVGLPTVDIE